MLYEYSLGAASLFPEVSLTGVMLLQEFLAFVVEHVENELGILNGVQLTGHCSYSSGIIHSYSVPPIALNREAKAFRPISTR
jgi:hypothetical protein